MISPKALALFELTAGACHIPRVPVCDFKVEMFAFSQYFHFYIFIHFPLLVILVSVHFTICAWAVMASLQKTRHFLQRQTQNSRMFREKEGERARERERDQRYFANKRMTQMTQMTQIGNNDSRHNARCIVSHGYSTKQVSAEPC